MNTSRTQPLLALEAERQELTAPLWYALGVAAIVHSFADPERVPLNTLEHAAKCASCPPRFVAEGLILRLDAKYLTSEGLQLMLTVCRTALRKQGYALEFHPADAGTERAHIAVYVQHVGTASDGMKLAAPQAAGLIPNLCAATEESADGGAVQPNSSRWPLPERRRSRQLSAPCVSSAKGGEPA